MNAAYTKREGIPVKRQKPATGRKHATDAVRRRRIIVGAAAFFFLLFFTMASYTANYAYHNYQKLLNNNYNGRQRVLARQNIRGKIIASGGETLAATETDGEGNEKRSYPYGSLFAHAVGYSTRGKMGIEADYNYYLITSDLPITERLDTEIAGEKIPADNVVTSLRVDLQEICEKALGVYRGAAIVSEPSTGRILAMVSKPDFEPEEIADIWESLLADKEDSRLVNRATQGYYPPGSTFKILTSLAYIREHPGDYADYRFTCNGHFARGSERISCFHGTVHGRVDFTQSFAKSCNSSFANIGLGLDREKFGKLLNDLYFNAPLPVSFPCNQSACVVDGALADEDMMQISIGQGKTQMTPLHLHLLTNAIANGGSFHQPTLADRIEAANGRIVKDFTADKGYRIMTEEETAVLTDMMREVVLTGTGKRLANASYHAAGKTGSAEYNGVKEDSHAWFTGFAPAESPEICVTVIIEGVGSGGEYAVPIAKRIFDAYFDAEE